MNRYTDEVDAALTQLSYERTEDEGFLGPFGKNIFGALISSLFTLATKPSLNGLPEIASRLVNAWQDDHMSRTHGQQVYVVDQIINKMRLHDNELQSIRSDSKAQQEIASRLSNLIASVLLASQGAASNEKLDHLASIAVSGALIYKNDPEEQSHEFIRIASQLAATDILVLRELARSQEATLASASVRDENINPLQSDCAGFLNELTALVQPVYYRSAFVRLQALGMVERMTPGFGSPDPPYEVLELGVLFLGYLSEHHTSSGNEQQQDVS